MKWIAEFYRMFKCIYEDDITGAISHEHTDVDTYEQNQDTQTTPQQRKSKAA